MAIAQDLIVVGIFHQSEQTKQALSALERAGYSENKIGFLVHTSAAWPEDDILLSAATEAVEGGLRSGVLYAAAALFIPGFDLALAGGTLLTTFGAGSGALAGSLIGTLVNIGIPEKEAYHYQRELGRGRTIVTVKAVSGYDEVLAILHGYGASEVKVLSSEWNAALPLR